MQKRAQESFLLSFPGVRPLPLSPRYVIIIRWKNYNKFSFFFSSKIDMGFQQRFQVCADKTQKTKGKRKRQDNGDDKSEENS